MWKWSGVSSASFLTPVHILRIWNKKAPYIRLCFCRQSNGQECNVRDPCYFFHQVFIATHVLYIHKSQKKNHTRQLQKDTNILVT